MMKMNAKGAKNTRRGFMCQTPGGNAACMASEPLSVIVQRRPDHARLIDRTQYGRLAEPPSRGLARPAARRSVPKAVPSNNVKDIDEQRKSSSQSQVLASKDQVFQVVVMRVSLHCQGCAGKVKKHLSKMEGVTSFSIDLESKRVTVMGHVSPPLLVESISKVKRAELWPSSATC